MVALYKIYANAGIVGCSNVRAPVEPSINGRDFTVEGQRKDINIIFLKLRISDPTGSGMIFYHHLL